MTNKLRETLKGRHCRVCGRPIPRGRHNTCSFKCKVERGDELADNLARRQRVSKGLGGYLKGLFDVQGL